MKIGFDVDKNAALLGGMDRYGLIVVEVPAGMLSQAEREFLVTYCTGMQEGTKKAGVDYYLHNWQDCGPMRVSALSLMRAIWPPAVEGKPEEVRRLIAGAIAELERIAASRAEQEAEDRRLKLAKPIDDFIRTDRTDSYGNKFYTTLYYMPSGDWFEAKLAEIKAEIERRNNLAAEKAALDAAQAQLNKQQEKLEEEKRVKALRDWALHHGSETLKMRITGGFHWRPLAQEEFADRACAWVGELPNVVEAACPRGFKMKKEEDKEQPTLEEMTLWNTIVEAIKNKGDMDAAILHVVYKEQRDEDDDDVDGTWSPRTLVRTEFRLFVTTPDGQEMTRDFRIDTE